MLVIELECILLKIAVVLKVCTGRTLIRQFTVPKVRFAKVLFEVHGSILVALLESYQVKHSSDAVTIY